MDNTKKTAETKTITLPTTKIKAETQNPRLLLLYGMPKVGKTTVLSQLEESLLIDLESGSDFVEAVKIKANSLHELGEICKAIKTANKPYKYIAIDTIDKVEEWCEGSATNRYKKSPQGANFKGDNVLTLPMGAGYLYLRQDVLKWVEYLRTITDNLILISHLKLSNINKGGNETQVKDIDLTGKIKNIVCGMADAIGYMYRHEDTGELIVSFKTNDEVTCGSRCEHLKGVEFPFDWKKIYV